MKRNRSSPKRTAAGLAELSALYREVDEAAALLAERLGGRLKCREGCGTCCIEGISVFLVEAENIRTHYGPVLDAGKSHPEGGCAFLDAAGRCRIYEHRPYVCRTQGLPLRWTEEDEQGGIVELRDICTLNEEGAPVEALCAEDCWTLGPFEERLAALQHELFGTGERIMLRDLFTNRIVLSDPS